MEEFHTEIYFMNVKLQLFVLKTNRVKDKLFCFGDIQESENNNKEIIKYVLEIFNDNGYDLSDLIFISSGDMYGESCYDSNGQYIQIRGSDGIPNYNSYNFGNKLYYVYGNHDLPFSSDNQDIVEINGIHIMNNGTSITGIHGIYSKKYPNYKKSVKSLQEADLVVTHDIPKEDLTKIKCKIHMFGHHHFSWGWKLTDKLYLNTDSRFILLIPEWIYIDKLYFKFKIYN